MVITADGYDELFRQLCNLKIAAPCHNDDNSCKAFGCKYCIWAIPEWTCAINIVRNEAERSYKEYMKGI